MKSKAKNVTDATIKAWQKVRPKSAKACGQGLYFRTHASGADQWYFRYSLHGRAKWVFLGNYPDKTLADARRDARKARVALDEGRDIARERQQAKRDARAAKDLAALADYWYEAQIDGRIEHPEVVRRRLDNHIIPVIGRCRLDEIGPREVDLVLRKCRMRYPATANNALRDLRRMFKFAYKRELMAVNPAANFDLADAGGPQKSRSRILAEDELVRLFVAMDGSCAFGRCNALAVRLLLALCVRKMELLGAVWEEFDLGNGEWYLGSPTKTLGQRRTKSETDLVIPLAPAVVGWLEELKVFAAGSAYLFPARRRSRQARFPHMSPDTLNLALKQLASGVNHFTVHDLRRTARSMMSGLGVPKHVGDRALNHKVPGVSGIYDRYDYFAERRHALALLADKIEYLESRAAA